MKQEEKKEEIPLILDLAEDISNMYDENGNYLGHGFTTVGPPDDIDAGGTD